MADAKDLGFKREDIAPPEWRYNPGKSAFKPDLSQYEPNLQKSLKEWLDGYEEPKE